MERALALRQPRMQVPIAGLEIVALMERLLRLLWTGRWAPPSQIGKTSGLSTSILAFGFPCFDQDVVDLVALEIDPDLYIPDSDNVEFAHTASCKCVCFTLPSLSP